MPDSPVTARNRGPSLGPGASQAFLIWCDMTSDIQKAIDKVAKVRTSSGMR